MKKRKICLSMLIFGFLLGIQDGRIALWRDGEAAPVQVFPYAASSLPAEDQARLERGIPIESREDLIRLIEDYLS